MWTYVCTARVYVCTSSVELTLRGYMHMYICMYVYVCMHVYTYTHLYVHIVRVCVCHSCAAFSAVHGNLTDRTDP